MQADVLAAARERFEQAGKAGMSVERLPSGGLLDEVHKTIERLQQGPAPSGRRDAVGALIEALSFGQLPGGHGEETILVVARNRSREIIAAAHIIAPAWPHLPRVLKIVNMGSLQPGGGTHLVVFAALIAAERGLDSITLTADLNTNAVAFYRAMGGRLTGQGRIDFDGPTISELTKGLL
jgi:hypothetical protein